MGLGFDHKAGEGHHCPSWSYGGFNRFRKQLAAVEGFNLDAMQGFGAGGIFSGTRVSGTRSWDEIHSPLKPLLDHADDRGDLTIDECAQVAPRLQEIVGQWPDDPEHHYDRANGLALVECMVTCLLFDSNLRFC